MKVPTIPPRLAGKIVKYRQLSEPIRFQDLEDSAPAHKLGKVNGVYLKAFDKLKMPWNAVLLNTG